MNAQMQAIPGTALTLSQRASQALAASKSEAQLTELAKASQSITKVTNAAGREQAHSAYMTLRNVRIEIERAGKDARDDATKFSKAVIAEENRLKAITADEEARLQKLRDDWDNEKELEKQRRIEAELARVTALNQRIADIRHMADVPAAMTSDAIAKLIATVNAIPVDDSFEELQPQAGDAKLATIARLQDAHANALAREAEAARVKEEREELARLRAEQEERNRVEQARIAEEQRLARIDRERIESEARVAREAEEELHRAARAAEEEELRRQREALAAEQAEAARIARHRQEELDRQADEQRLAREALEREQAALRASQEPPAASVPGAGAVPTGAEMLAVLVDHYDETPETVLHWIENAEWEIAA